MPSSVLEQEKAPTLGTIEGKIRTLSSYGYDTLEVARYVRGELGVTLRRTMIKIIAIRSYRYDIIIMLEFTEREELAHHYRSIIPHCLKKIYII